MEKKKVRLRTIEEAHKVNVNMDPNTKITKYFIKTLVLDGTIPSIRVGKRKRLINVDLLLNMFENPELFEKGGEKDG